MHKNRDDDEYNDEYTKKSTQITANKLIRKKKKIIELEFWDNWIENNSKFKAFFSKIHSRIEVTVYSASDDLAVNSFY